VVEVEGVQTAPPLLEAEVLLEASEILSQREHDLGKRVTEVTEDAPSHLLGHML
jgi:hypothetical protein